MPKFWQNNGYRTIVIVGGDGALNDAINGIMLSDAEDKENIALGMIPNGIGNDFAKYWGLSTEYKPAVDCIINHRLKKIDVGFCNFYDGKEHQRRYFLNAVNIGLGARIVKITDQTKRFWGVKFLSYVAALFSLIFERKLYRMHLRIKDEHIRGRINDRMCRKRLGLGTDSECRTLQRLAGCIRHLPSGIPANHFGIVDADSGKNPEP